MEFVLILSTIDTDHHAKMVAEKLISSQLAACVNIIPGIQSVYEWEGKYCHDKERLLLIKTTKENETDLYQMIQKIHPYELPEIISLPIQNGSPDYLNWIRKKVSPR